MNSRRPIGSPLLTSAPYYIVEQENGRCASQQIVSALTEMGLTRSLQCCPLHDRSSAESGSPSAVLLCLKRANCRREQMQQQPPCRCQVYSITASEPASSVAGPSTARASVCLRGVLAPWRGRWA